MREGDIHDKSKDRINLLHKLYIQFCFTKNKTTPVKVLKRYFPR